MFTNSELIVQSIKLRTVTNFRQHIRSEIDCRNHYKNYQCQLLLKCLEQRLISRRNHHANLSLIFFEHIKRFPELVGRIPVRSLNKVVFPAPFTPSRPKHWPSGIPKHSSSTATKIPLVLCFERFL